MRNLKGQFIKGYSSSPDTQFKKGQHWRKPKPFWDKEWLFNEYITNGKSSKDIANEQSCKRNNILFWIHKHNIPLRNISEARKKKHWGQSGCDNPMWNRKGELNPQWKGGITPDRQSFYQSQGWKKACSFVWKRDNATCRRCGIKANNGIPLHIHHIKSFEYKDKRADVNNLVLLCLVCHHFVHSKKNINNEFKEVIQGDN